MTNFNDGKWHGWNGGECPVHPKSRVETVWIGAGDGSPYVDGAGNFSWGHGEGEPNIVAFRVVKVHREPREIWVRTGVQSEHCYSPHVARNEPFEGATLFREVLQ